MEGRRAAANRSAKSSFIPPKDRNANVKKVGRGSMFKSSEKVVGEMSGRYVSSSHSVSSVTKLTTVSSTNKRVSTNVVDEKIVTTTKIRPKVDLPDRLISSRSSSTPKRPGQHTDVELQFAGMFDTKTTEEPKPKGPEDDEELHPVQDHRTSPVMFLETLEGDRKGGRRDVKEHKRQLTSDDKLFTLDISPEAPKKTSQYETHRGVYERTISTESTKIDQPALNLHQLDTLIHRSDQKEVESQPSQSSGQPQTQEGDGEKKTGSYVSSYSIPRDKGSTRPSDETDEEVITATENRRKIDLPNWLVPNLTSRTPKRPDQHADIELQFAGMFDTKKKEEPKPKGPEVVEEIHPVQDHRPSPVMFLETLEADQKERPDVKERRRHVPLDDKLFTVDISPEAPKKRSNYETRRGVYERTISPESKKIDQPAVNLHHLDTLIHRSDQKEVEVQPSRSGGQPQMDDKEEDEDEDEDDEFIEEIILVEVKRKLRLPKWFVNHPEKKPKSMKCLDDLLPALQESAAEKHSAPEGTLVVDEVHVQEIVSGNKGVEINLHDLLKM